MKIAIACQNENQITAHAGHCRKFWIYDTEDTTVLYRQRLELPKEQSFHESSPHSAHPLDMIKVFIAGGMGKGLMRRLDNKGIQGIITSETDPDKAVSAYLDGSLVQGSPEKHSHGHSTPHHDCCRQGDRG